MRESLYQGARRRGSSQPARDRRRRRAHLPAPGRQPDRRALPGYPRPARQHGRRRSGRGQPADHRRDHRGDRPTGAGRPGPAGARPVRPPAGAGRADAGGVCRRDGADGRADDRAVAAARRPLHRRGAAAVHRLHPAADARSRSATPSGSASACALRASARRRPEARSSRASRPPSRRPRVSTPRRAGPSGRSGTTRAPSGRRRRSSRPAPRGSARARAARPSAGTGARGTADAGDRAVRRRSGPSRRVARPSISSDAWATLNTASSIGTSLRERGARVLGPDRLGRERPAPPRAPSAARTGARFGPSHTTNPPFSAAATLSGWPSSSVASPSTSASSSNRWSAASRPATTAAALDPSPPDSGMPEPIVNSNPSAGCRRSNARTTRLVPVARDVEVGVDARTCRSRATSSSRCSASAAASVSKPGPRLADEAGTRTTRRRASPDVTRAPRARSRPARDRTARPRRPARARSADP